MNRYEYAIKLGFSVERATELARVSGIHLDSDSPIEWKMMYRLSRSEHLTILQLLVLDESPRLLLKLRSYRALAERQIKALDAAEMITAPGYVLRHLASAGQGERESVEAVIDWLKETLPFYPVSYHWIGIRLLAKVSVGDRKRYERQIWPALEKCRFHPRFQDWWRKDVAEYRNPIRFGQPPCIRKSNPDRHSEKNGPGLRRD